MQEIEKHPILSLPKEDFVNFEFNGKLIKGNKGYTIAAALHQAGYPVHSHSLNDRNRSLECGIGKCGACEMLVDGKIKRICITKVDDVKQIQEIPQNFIPQSENHKQEKQSLIYKTEVLIIGAGPAGLAAREQLNKYHVPNILVDNNDKIGGQFTMQTHQFFFFEKEKKYGGMRGFDIAAELAGDDRNGIMLDCVVWDILENKNVGVKNLITNEIFYIQANSIVVATGAIPFMPSFKNDDLPGVYTAAVVQKMMNNEFTLLGKNILTIGAGNIGYLTSYQLMQAGAKVKAIIEAADKEGGFPVQANRVRRLGIPVFTNHILIEAIPNDDHSGIIGAVVAECKNFQPVKGTEKTIMGIDAINICTGLVPDDQLMQKGVLLFGRDAYSVGDALRIGEGTSALLRGKQVAYEIIEKLGIRFNYDEYLDISKEYIESQQHPIKKIEKPFCPSRERAEKNPYIIIDCLYGFACNPCEFSCSKKAITKTSTSTVPHIDFDKCIGCMECVYQCPGLAIFGYNEKKNWLFLPVEYEVTEGQEVFLVDNNGNKLGEGIIEKITLKPNKTNLARVKSLTLQGEELSKARGFIVKENYPATVEFNQFNGQLNGDTYICHCEDVKLEDILKAIGDQKFISIDEIKHITRLGMGACRGKRCIKRLKQAIAPYGIEIVGDAIPRAPMSNQVTMGDLLSADNKKIYTNVNKTPNKRIKVQSLIAGGGIAGSSLFRYMSEAGMKPVLLNKERGSSWRNIAGGRPAFSLPALADIAVKNKELFIELQKLSNIDYKPTRYVNFAHDESSYQLLEKTKTWSDAYMVESKDFTKEISPYFNVNNTTYNAALITNDCWQATPGKTIDLLRKIAVNKGGQILEDCQIIDVYKENNNYIVLVKNHCEEYIEYECEHFVNALGENADYFAKRLGYQTNLYPVKHQAFITRRLPLIGKNGNSLDMLIDRRKYKGFSAIYGQQLSETGQIIGCASPSLDHKEVDKDMRINTVDFLEIVSEVFANWIPQLSNVGFQAVWSGYYVEPRYIIDTDRGLFIGMRGHGFMLSQYLAKLYTDKLLGKEIPDYFNELALTGNGLDENALK